MEDEDGNDVEGIYIPDEFEAMAEFGRRNRGGGSGQEEIKVQSEWEQLSRGKTLGKTIRVVQQSGTFRVGGNMLEVRGKSDDDALALSIAFSPPLVIAAGLVPAGTTVDNVNGLQNNQELAAAGGFSFGNPIAVIEWGVGGVLLSIEIDIHNGALCTIVGSFVRVGGFVLDENSTDAFWQLGACIGPGRDKGLGLQRTIHAFAPAVNVATSMMRVPLFSRRVSVSGMGAAGIVFAGEIRFFRDSTLINPVASFIMSANNPGPVFVPNGAYYFTVTPLVAALTNLQIVFDLAI